ncbi:MAG: M28 family peptidase [Thermofilum sp.]
MLGLFSEAAYAYEVARRLASHPRFTGSEGERTARELAAAELRSMGYEVSFEPFTVKVFEVLAASLEVVDPPAGFVPCSAVGFSGETGEDGVEGELAYIERGDAAVVPAGSGWIGLASARPEKDRWRKLAGKAAGLVIAESSPVRGLSRVDVPYEWRERYGSLPAVYVKYRDALSLLDARRVRLTLLQEYRDAEAQNLIAEKRGWKYPEEVVYVVAHLDSVYGVQGALDNAAGSALVLALAKALRGVECKRTVRFALFSGEELGLRGSQAHVERVKDALRNAVLVVNLDVHGAAFGSTSIIVTGSKSLRHYAESLARRLGVKVDVSEDVMSSDSASFARHEVPSVNIYRSSGAGYGIHTVDDSPDLLHPLAFELPGFLALELVREVADAEELPFEREIPEEVKRKVDEYFRKRLGILE